MTERFRRVNYGTLEIEITVEDRSEDVHGAIHCQGQPEYYAQQGVHLDENEKSSPHYAVLLARFPGAGLS